MLIGHNRVFRNKERLSRRLCHPQEVCGSRVQCPLIRTVINPPENLCAEGQRWETFLASAGVAPPMSERARNPRRKAASLSDPVHYQAINDVTRRACLYRTLQRPPISSDVSAKVREVVNEDVSATYVHDTSIYYNNRLLSSVRSLSDTDSVTPRGRARRVRHGIPPHASLRLASRTVRLQACGDPMVTEIGCTAHGRGRCRSHESCAGLCPSCENKTLQRCSCDATATADTLDTRGLLAAPCVCRG